MNSKLWRIAGCAVMAVAAFVSLYGCWGDGGGGIPGDTTNKSPIAAIVAELGDGRYTYDLNGSFSTDSDGNIIAWEWELGDGDTAVGEYIEHTYRVPGNYVVGLTVIDNDGATGAASTIVSIEGCSPFAEFAASPDVILVSGAVNVTVSFDGRMTEDCDGVDDICWGVWDFGDGTTPVSGIWTRHEDDGDGVTQRYSVMREVRHTYKRLPRPEYTPGQTEPQTLHYTVTLTVSDCQGHTSTTTQDIVFYEDIPTP